MSGGAILVLDDDDASRMTFAALLEQDGHRVHEAATLEEAEAALEEHDVGLVLADYNLDEGRGTDLLPAARAHRCRPRFVIVSGDDEAAFLPGIDGSLRKGDDPRQALALIRGWLPDR